jgi:hypothetical protein
MNGDLVGAGLPCLTGMNVREFTAWDSGEAKWTVRLSYRGALGEEDDIRVHELRELDGAQAAMEACRALMFSEKITLEALEPGERVAPRDVLSRIQAARSVGGLRSTQLTSSKLAIRSATNGWIGRLDDGQEIVFTNPEAAMVFCSRSLGGVE